MSPSISSGAWSGPAYGAALSTAAINGGSHPARLLLTLSRSKIGSAGDLQTRVIGQVAGSELGEAGAVPAGGAYVYPAACAALVGLAAQLVFACRAAGSSRPALRPCPSLRARECVRAVPVDVRACGPAVGHHR